jgi:hypothetical protein
MVGDSNLQHCEPGMAKVPPVMRFSGVLLFRFEVGQRRKSYGMLRHEFRICVLAAQSHADADAEFRSYARNCEYEYTNTDGEEVRFRFVRLIECLALSDVFPQDGIEMWYDYVTARPSDLSKLRRLPLKRVF